MSWKNLTPEEHDFLYVECESFKPDTTKDEYYQDIKRYLMLCSWHFSEEGAEIRIQQNVHFIEQAFLDKEPVADIALDIGYSCG